MLALDERVTDLANELSVERQHHQDVRDVARKLQEDAFTNKIRRDAERLLHRCAREHLGAIVEERPLESSALKLERAVQNLP